MPLWIKRTFQTLKSLSCLIWLLTFATAQELQRLPDSLITYDGSALMIPYGEGHLTHIEGLGWLATELAELPEVRADGVYVSEAFLQQMLAGQTALTDQSTPTDPINFEDDRPPAPVENPSPAPDTGNPEATPEITVLPPPAVPTPAEPAPESGPNLLSFFPFLPSREITQTVHPGVVYKKFFRETAHGESTIHLLEIAPEAGHFRVVGASRTAAKTSELASGGIAAINAGYFDTESFATIGFLKVDYGLQSLPSRNRASIGFGLGAPTIDRIETHIRLHVNGQQLRPNVPDEGGPLVLWRSSGEWVGSPRQGVLVVDSNQRVIANKVGPRRIPEGGFALVYEPDMRALALLNEGTPIGLEVVISPSIFGSLRYAVEAGPLLLREGRIAYQPELEAFQPGTPIIDSVTQQAAVGVKADGTTLLITSNNMTAQDLIPLFLELGAQDAMRLDSGSSTTMVVDGKVVNRTFERRVVTAIVFIPNSRQSLSTP